VAEDLNTVRAHTNDLRAIQATLDPKTGSAVDRRSQFDTLAANLSQRDNATSKHMARTMTSFAKGLFAGGQDERLPIDNLALERAFRLPKGHERRIHGRAHAGVRIVQRGHSLLLTLDAHARHPEPFAANDLIPWLDAKAPPAQQESIRRRRVMRMARSTTKRPLLLASLEHRYRNASLVT
jgi:hypothetical protein